MEKVVVGQKVVRKEDTSNNGSWFKFCKESGIEPFSPVTVSTVSDSGKWFCASEIKGLGLIENVWCACFFNLVEEEPAEASPAVVFTRAATPITVGCVVIRKADCMTSEWSEICKKNGAVEYDHFTVTEIKGSRMELLSSDGTKKLFWMFTDRFEVF